MVQINSVLKENLTCKKSNFLISSMYRSSLLENKMLALALATAYDDGERIISRLSVPELKIILNKNTGKKISGSFYTQLKSVADEMTGRKIFVENKDKNAFLFVNLVNSASYADGIFTIKFDSDLKDYILNLQGNYTNLDIAVLMSFEKMYSYRLYELLKSKAYSFSKRTKEYQASFGISELKLILGVVDTGSEAVNRALKKNNPDYDHIVNDVSKNKNFNVWSDFQKRVIAPAVSEINEKSDICVEYDVVREGLGGKIVKIIFSFRKKDVFDIPKSYKKIDEVKKKAENELIEQLKAYIDEPLTKKDYKVLLDAANNNVEKIKKAYDLAAKQKHINNLVGWMKSAIKNDYTEDGVEMRHGMNHKELCEYNELIDNLMRSD